MEKKEIIKRWRELGLLNGLKEGSINEWRCAKSYENLAESIIGNENEYEGLGVIGFAFIKKALCSGRPRINRILTGKEILDFFKSVTMNDVIEYIDEKNIPSLKSKKKKIANLLIIKKYFQMKELTDLPVIRFFRELNVINNEEGICAHDCRFLRTLGIIDMEAEITATLVEMFQRKN